MTKLLKILVKSPLQLKKKVLALLMDQKNHPLCYQFYLHIAFVIPIGIPPPSDILDILFLLDNSISLSARSVEADCPLSITFPG